jgi:hypothetical protein
MATECKLTEKQFKNAAKPLTVKVGADTITLEPRVFAQGKDAAHPSFGWAYNGKVNVPVNGESCVVQASINLPLVGSKKAARE